MLRLEKFWHAHQGGLIALICIGGLLAICSWTIQPLASASEPQISMQRLDDADREYLVMMYEEQAEHARLHEELRGSATGFFVALIAGLLAFAVGSGEAEAEAERASVAGCIIFLTSIIGALLNFKHYERFKMHLERLKRFRAALERGVSEEFRTISEAADRQHNLRYPVLHSVKLYALWLAIFLITGLTGLALMIGFGGD